MVGGLRPGSVWRLHGLGDEPEYIYRTSARTPDVVGRIRRVRISEPGRETRTHPVSKLRKNDCVIMVLSHMRFYQILWLYGRFHNGPSHTCDLTKYCDCVTDSIIVKSHVRFTQLLRLCGRFYNCPVRSSRTSIYSTIFRWFRLGLFFCWFRPAAMPNDLYLGCGYPSEQGHGYAAFCLYDFQIFYYEFVYIIYYEFLTGLLY